MKIIYSFILCTYFCIAAAFAQQYVPFPTENAIWRGYSSWQEGSIQYIVRTAGDTFINRQQYTKLLEEGNYLRTPYAGAFREDNRTIYIVPNDSTTEFIWYDFNNLQIGDTVSNWWNYRIGVLPMQFHAPVWVYDIDSVQINDGTFRKQYHVVGEWGEYQTSFIEGIGSLAGTFEGNWGVEYSASLICLRSGFTISWITPGVWGECTAAIRVRLDAEEAPENSFAINMYPNPANDILHIASDVDLSAQATIYNTLGQAQTQAELFGNQHSIDISSLADGIYYLHLQTQKGEKVSYKFVKAQP
jgi:hypothetical protein